MADALVPVAAVTSLRVDDVVVARDRIRPVAEAGVEALLHVIKTYGFTTPIIVRKVKAGFVLIDGAHRLEALRRLGVAEVPVRAFTCTDDAARAAEASQNLAGSDLTPLDDALFLAAYQDAYLRLHPETARGIAGAVARHQGANELSSFAQVIADKRSITPRHVQKLVAAGRNLQAEDVARLRTTPQRLTLKDIQDLGNIADASERRSILEKIASGQAKKVSQARTLYAAEKGETAAPKDPVEEGFKALLNAWSRAPAAARRRFVDEQRDALSALLDGGDE